MSWQAAFQGNPTTRRRRIGTIGDVNPVDYGGGFIYRNEYGTYIEYTHGLDSSDSPDRMQVYRVDVPNDVFGYHGWAARSIDSIASTIGADPDALLKAGRSRKLMDRVYALDAITSTYGWHELDNYPLTVTEKELRRRWRA